MKYPHLKEEQQKQFDVPMGLCGISEEDQSLLLRECENVYVSDGVLRCREGLGKKAAERVHERSKYTYIFKPLLFTDTTVEMNGKAYRIATLKTGNGTSFNILWVYFVSEEETFCTGGMFFDTTMFNELCTPSNVKFFSGGKTKGCGIYAFVELVDMYTYKPKYDAVFELSTDYTEWIRIYDDQFYCPVIYINGRGNLYDEIGDITYTYAPMELEELNLINSRFKAYFTSDGHSSVFQLPISKLDNSDFVCRVYSSPTEYTEWTVPANSSEAATTFGNVSVTLQVNRVTGTFKFLSGGSEFPIYKMNQYRGNNIEISANKTIEGARKAVFASRNCFDFNSHIYFYGDTENPNKIFAARSETPLYFPKKAAISVGNDNLLVMCMASHNNKLLAFKKNAIYHIKVNDGKNYSSNELLIKHGDIFYKGDNFSSEVLTDRFGCAYGNTMCESPMGLFWMGDKNQIYHMKSDSHILCVSKDISDILESLEGYECEKVSIVPFSNGILVYQDKKAYVLQYENSKTLWFNWKFPSALILDDIANINGMIKFTVRVNNGDTVLMLGLSGEEDVVGYKDGFWSSEPINFSFETKNLNFNNELSLKVINSVLLKSKYGNSFKAFLLDEEGNTQNSIYFKNWGSKNGYKNLKLRGNICGVNSSALRVSGKAPFSLSKILYSYLNSEEIF